MVTSLLSRAAVTAALGLVGTGVLLSGCGGGDGAETVTVALAEQDGSGQAGEATLTRVDDGHTEIAMQLSNPPRERQPAHVHRGPCDDLGAVVAPLNSLEDGRSETVVSVPLGRLLRGGLVVHAHRSEADYETSVACAPLRKSSTESGY